ncbi:MAG TPA: hypothetical protein VME69_13955, partial [Methylocella sp.]|nr:hypothetical protein [Methylocella sp.]
SRSGKAEGITIIKFGGSLALQQQPQCAAWLDALAVSSSPLILVPGGGPFSDQVRRAQALMRFDDRSAHRMALLAMAQFGLALAAHRPLFIPAQSHEEINQALEQKKIPVWLPESMVLAAPEVPQSWEMTSDSLAAWLAGVMAAPRLLLIKSCDIEAGTSVQQLVAEKIVDPLFASFAASSGAEVWLAGPAALADAARRLQSGQMPGINLPLS